jgi:hypothetical protein
MDKFNRKAIFILLALAAILVLLIFNAIKVYNSQTTRTYNQNPPKNGLAIKLLKVEQHGALRKCGLDPQDNSQLTAQVEVTNYTKTPIIISLTDCRVNVYRPGTKVNLDINPTLSGSKPYATDIRIIAPGATNPLEFQSLNIPIETTGEATIIVTISPLSKESQAVMTKEQKARYPNSKSNDQLFSSSMASFRLVRIRD